jgi:nitrogen fixation/metabolism regulation signal transduction histidine kinase
VIAPLLIVYMSSLEFINQGIDSWFKVEVKQGLSDALGLSRAALDVRMREYSLRTQALAEALTRATSPADVQSRLNVERRASQALEVVLFGAQEHILAASLENPQPSGTIQAAANRASSLRSIRCPGSSQRCRRPCRARTRSTAISQRCASRSSTASA